MFRYNRCLRFTCLPYGVMVAAALAVLSAAVLLSPNAPRAGAAKVYPSPGPIATVMPVPCTAGAKPVRVHFQVASVSMRHVPRQVMLTNEPQVEKLYRAFCSLPPVKHPNAPRCTPRSGEVVYSVALRSSHAVILTLNLGMGACRFAGISVAGYVASYYVPRRVVTLVAAALRVPFKRLYHAPRA